MKNLKNSEFTKNNINVILYYFVFIIFLITLYPFQFRLPDKILFHWYFYFSGFMFNIIFFIPVGFLFKMKKKPGKDLWGIQPLIFGFSLSFIIEILQLAAPLRVTSSTDLIANSLGAWLGALGFVIIQKGIEQRKSQGIFFLELPLIGLIYLLTPLLWLNGLSAAKEPTHLLIALLPCLIGIYLIISVVKNNQAKPKKNSINIISLLIFSWLVISTIPAGLLFPVPVYLLIILLTLCSNLIMKLSKPNLKKSSRERRYEIPTLKKIVPFFILYLVLAFLLSSDPNSSLLQMKVGSTKIKTFFMIRFIEQIGGSTLLGYLIAEMRGRKNEPLIKTLFTVFSYSFIVVSGSMLIIQRGKINLTLFMGITLIVVSSLCGALIYHQHLKTIIRNTQNISNR